MVPVGIMLRVQDPSRKMWYESVRFKSCLFLCHDAKKHQHKCLLRFETCHSRICIGLARHYALIHWYMARILIRQWNRRHLFSMHLGSHNWSVAINNKQSPQEWHIQILYHYIILLLVWKLFTLQISIWWKEFNWWILIESMNA